MNFRRFGAWGVKERERMGAAKALSGEMKQDGMGNFRRVYLFSMPILSTLARLDRERQLFNIAIKEQIHHDHSSQDSRKRFWFLLPLVMVAITIFLVRPPAVLKKQVKFLQDISVYQTIFFEQLSVRKKEFQVGFARDISQPPRVWIAANESLARWLRPSAVNSNISSTPVIPAPIPMEGVHHQIAQEVAEIEQKSLVHWKAEEAATDPVSAETVKTWSNHDPIVVVLRGTAKLENGKVLSRKDLVKRGSTITTGPRSFVKLLFRDQTQLNIGADTTMKIEASPSESPTLIHLLGGQVRAKVKREMQNESEEKFLIRTKTAAMGVRGTDFHVTFTDSMGGLTQLVTFQGSVALTKLQAVTDDAVLALKNPIGLVKVMAGMYSGVRQDLPQAAPPVALDPKTSESLKWSSDVQGEKERYLQEQTIRSIQSVLQQGAPISGRYQSIDVEDEGASANRPAPKRDQYRVVPTPPSDLSRDNEFPDR